MYKMYIERIKSFSSNSRLFLLNSAFIALSTVLFSFFFNLYLRALGFEMNFVGLLNSIIALSTGISGIPFGIAADRYGRKKMLLLSCIALCISVMGFALLFQKSLYVVLSILIGASNAGIYVISNPFMSENSTDCERVHLFSVYSALSMFMYAVGNIIGGYAFTFLHTFFSGVDAYRILLFSSALFVFLSILPLLLLKERSEHESINISIKSKALILKFVIFMGLLGLGGGFILPYFNVFFKECLGAREEFIGVLFGVGTITLALSALFSPLISEKMGKIRATFWSQMTSIPFLALIAFSHNLWAASLGYVMRAVCMNMTTPIMGAFSMEKLEKEERATASSFMVTSWQICWAITSNISGNLMRGGDYTMPYVGAIVVYIFTGIAVWIFFWKQEYDIERV